MTISSMMYLILMELTMTLSRLNKKVAARNMTRATTIAGEIEEMLNVVIRVSLRVILSFACFSFGFFSFFFSCLSFFGQDTPSSPISLLYQTSPASVHLFKVVPFSNSPQVVTPVGS